MFYVVFYLYQLFLALYIDLQFDVLYSYTSYVLSKIPICHGLFYSYQTFYLNVSVNF